MTRRYTLHEHKAKKAGKHHDLRLEKNKYVESWAIPKGLPVNRGVKRLAIRTQRHPKSSLSFKGKIPEGEYGAGLLKILKKGTYDLIKKKGKVYEFKLKGKTPMKYRMVRLKDKNWMIERI